MSAKFYYDQLYDILKEVAQQERAVQMEAYMRHKFTFLGVPAPERKFVAKAMVKEHGMLAVEEWEAFAWLCFAPAAPREMQYILGDLLVPKKKKLPEEWLAIIEKLITTLSWWDTVDWLAPHLAAAILFRNKKLAKQTSTRWIQSDNIWLQRSAIIFQLNAKLETDEELLYHHIQFRADSTEFFVQKAAGWALRQYSKTAPESVRDFIRENPQLPALTIREGSKILVKKGMW